MLEVNGIEMTGKSQTEAVSILRNTPTGSKVRIIVSRQEDVTDMNLPRIMVCTTVCYILCVIVWQYVFFKFPFECFISACNSYNPQNSYNIDLLV